MKKPALGRALILISMIIFISPLLFSGNTDREVEKSLRDAYENKTFILRYFYSGDLLKFNSEGILVSGGDPGIWTLDGLITINKLKIKNETIELTGKREFWSYDQKEKKPRQYKSSDKTIIEIGPFDSSLNATFFHQAIRKIFLKDDEPLHKAVPHYWENAVLNFFNGNDTLTNRNIKKNSFTREDNLVLPKLISQTRPQYTPIARQLRVGGISILRVKIDKKGDVSIEEIVTPVGLGLDESAIEALSEWKFTPAVLNGEIIDFETVLNVQCIIGS